MDALLDLFKDFSSTKKVLPVYQGCFADGGEGKPRLLPTYLGNNMHPKDCFD